MSAFEQFDQLLVLDAKDADTMEELLRIQPTAYDCVVITRRIFQLLQFPDLRGLIQINGRDGVRFGLVGIPPFSAS